MFPNIPKRKTATIQVWVSLTLIILALTMSFMPIIKVNTENLTDTIENFISNDNIDLDSIDLDSLPDEVEFTAPNLIQSGIFFVDIITFMAEEPDPDEFTEYIEEKIDEESTHSAIATTFAIISIFSDSIPPEIQVDNAMPIIFSITVSLVAFMYIILMILVIPIILIVKAIIAFAYALANLKNPEKATPKVSSSLTGLLSILFMMLLLQCALPQIKLAWGTILMLVITITSIVINSIAIRIPAYNKQDMLYANIVQGTSLAGILGFLIFFFSLIKTGILASFLKGPFLTFTDEFSDIKNFYASDYIIDGVLMIIYVICIFTAIKYISKVTRRLSLSCKKESVLLALPIFAIPVFIIPTVIKSNQNLNIVDNGEVLFETSSLYLTDSGETALIFVLIGAIIMLLAEIAYLVIPKILCKGMTPQQKLLVISGTMPEINVKPKKHKQETVQNDTKESAQESEDKNTQESEQETTPESN